MDVAIASCLNLPEPDHDEALLLAALNESGLKAGVLAWDDPSVDWSQARMTVLRSTWNYPQRREAFLEWAASTAQVSDLWNGLEVIRWNSHKKYLLDLESAGIPIAPTEFVARSSRVELQAIREKRNWGEVVVKPAVSAASFGALRVGENDSGRGEAHLRDLATNGDVLVQSYLPSVQDYGERALVWIDGELTHAVRKSPRFHGEDEAVSEEVEISPLEERLAERAIAMTGDLELLSQSRSLLYARIDLALGPNGDPVLMELEVIEPSLFLKQSISALEQFVAAIQRNLNR